MAKRLSVYFIIPEGCNKEELRRIKNILGKIRRSGCRLVHDEITDKTSKRKILPLFAAISFQEEYRKIEDSDLIITELSRLSSEVVPLIAYGLHNHKPVLGLLFGDTKPPETLSLSKKDSLKLYFEHYNEENIDVILRIFLAEIKKEMKKKGKFIVIEGTDGSGKATQLELLLRYLKRKGISCRTIDFPRYYSSFHGWMVGRYLTGEFGGIREINPYLASLTYALDRLTAKPQLEEWLQEGQIVIANRYTPSNMAHQTVKVKESEQGKFLDWLYEMEYKIHKIPKEDVVIFLHVPVEIGQRLLGNKDSRGYLAGKKMDIHEKDLLYQKKAERMYLNLASQFPHWEVVECVDEGKKLLSKQKIHHQVLNILQQRKLLDRAHDKI